MAKKKYEVKWQEQRTFNCYAEIEADSPEEAIKLAQDYSYEVDERESHTDEIFPGRAMEVTEEKD